MAVAGKTLNQVLGTWQKRIRTITKDTLWLYSFFKRKKGDRFGKGEGTLILQPLKERLFNAGVSGDGKTLPPYRKDYKEWKKARGVRTQPTTLFLNGAWYKSMFVSITGKLNYIIKVKTKGPGSATKNGQENSKTDYLKRKYGAAILQLTELEQERIAEEVADEIVRIFGEDSDMILNIK
jgi:hypothetical protein